VPVCERFGPGVLVWSPLAMGLLAGRLRRSSAESASASRLHWARQHMTDGHDHDALEALAQLAEQAGPSPPHLTLAFVTADPAVTSVIIGQRTPEQLDDLLAGAGTHLDDSLLDRIDEIAPPGTGAGPVDVACVPPALAQPELRRRTAKTRAVRRQSPQ
jgi:aryl-alcohol dehydrogenase-like predicted oxidoreductase